MKNIIQEKAFDFALEMIRLYKVLLNQKEYVLSKQLLRSATSIGANVEEAQAAQTKKDFVAKITIASKEARETRYWLKLLSASQFIQYDYTAHLASIDEIIRILTAICKTSNPREGE
jgi:four helix bundle protein